MTFQRWWENSMGEFEMPEDAMFTVLVKLLAQTAWIMGRREGCREMSERFRTTRPDPGKEG